MIFSWWKKKESNSLFNFSESYNLYTIFKYFTQGQIKVFFRKSITIYKLKNMFLIQL